MDSLEQVKVSLKKLTQEGTNTYGTSALVESLKTHCGMSYRELHAHAKCSGAGMTRWRSLDHGNTKRFAPLVSLAESLLVAEKSKTRSEIPAVSKATASYPSVKEAIKALTLEHLESRLCDALKIVLGTPLEGCSVQKVEMEDSTVKLMLVLK